ncbi:hypothetical protein H920_13147 [Fukomys damarensis]|uniref:Uncharacterized protein n=1 Tax=Fukomys damarensis TaxID=885580 RepID=A0A091DRF3_FUKDA|nr:hypothetical protein H920_13147 [Fukomys damarensis]
MPAAAAAAAAGAPGVSASSRAGRRELELPLSLVMSLFPPGDPDPVSAAVTGDKFADGVLSGQLRESLVLENLGDPIIEPARSASSLRSPGQVPGAPTQMYGLQTMENAIRSFPCTENKSQNRKYDPR